jgi:signal peptidase I
MKSDQYNGESKLQVRQRLGSEMIAWFWVALAFMLINGTIGQARVIPSGSMENTLLIGDHLIMSRIGYDAGVPFTNWHVPLWRNPHQFVRQPFLGLRPAQRHHRHTGDDLHVARRAARCLGTGSDP